MYDFYVFQHLARCPHGFTDREADTHTIIPLEEI